jgi:hypothetical protein
MACKLWQVAPGCTTMWHLADEVPTKSPTVRAGALLESVVVKVSRPQSAQKRNAMVLFGNGQQPLTSKRNIIINVDSVI